MYPSTYSCGCEEADTLGCGCGFCVRHCECGADSTSAVQGADAPLSDDAAFASARRSDRIYFSKEFRNAPDGGDANDERPKRFVYRVLKEGVRDEFVTVRGEVIIRVTDSGRQQIKGLFYVDDRKLQTLTLQRFTTGTGKPHKASNFTLRGDEINKLLELATVASTERFGDRQKMRIDEADLERFTVTREAARILARQNLEVLVELVEEEVTERDVTALA